MADVVSMMRDGRLALQPFNHRRMVLGGSHGGLARKDGRELAVRELRARCCSCGVERAPKTVAVSVNADCARAYLTLTLDLGSCRCGESSGG
jgi:hypothetical protein